MFWHCVFFLVSRQLWKPLSCGRSNKLVGQCTSKRSELYKWRGLQGYPQPVQLNAIFQTSASANLTNADPRWAFCPAGHGVLLLPCRCSPHCARVSLRVLSCPRPTSQSLGQPFARLPPPALSTLTEAPAHSAEPAEDLGRTGSVWNAAWVGAIREALVYSETESTPTHLFQIISSCIERDIPDKDGLPGCVGNRTLCTWRVHAVHST